MLDRPQRRQAASERTRRCRRRQRDGKIVVMVEVDHRVVDMLVRLRWLTEGEAFDKRATGEAIGRMLHDAAD